MLAKRDWIVPLYNISLKYERDIQSLLSEIE